MLNNMLEMDLKPATDPTTAPKPTSAQVLMTGRAQLRRCCPGHESDTCEHRRSDRPADDAGSGRVADGARRCRSAFSQPLALTVPAGRRSFPDFGRCR
jgi:hypothetical protein